MKNLTTDIELLEVKQGNGKAVVVGYDLAENPILEIFVEMHEFKIQQYFSPVDIIMRYILLLNVS